MSSVSMWPTPNGPIDTRGSVTLNDFECAAVTRQEILAPYVAQIERLVALLREVIDGSETDEYGVTMTWLERAKAEVGG